MSDHGTRWYENAVIYAVDVEAFQDADGDGTPQELLGSGPVRRLDDGRLEVDLDGYGYRWLRVERG